MHAHISYPLLGPPVVLFMEDRPFDHTFGCMELPGADYVKHGTPINGSNGTAMFTCGDAPYVCHGGTGLGNQAEPQLRAQRLAIIPLRRRCSSNAIRSIWKQFENKGLES